MAEGSQVENEYDNGDLTALKRSMNRPLINAEADRP